MACGCKFSLTVTFCQRGAGGSSRRERPPPRRELDDADIANGSLHHSRHGCRRHGGLLSRSIGSRSRARDRLSHSRGAWLYNQGKAVLHVIERSAIPEGCGVLDHVAFWGEDLPFVLARLEARGLPYDLRRLPEGGHAAGVWQLFFHDPNGACIEIDFAAIEDQGRRERHTLNSNEGGEEALHALRPLDRQRQHEDSSAARVRLRPDLPFVLLDDRMNDREADAEAMLFRL